MILHNRSSLTLTEVCQILAHHRRRQLLSYLAAKDTDVADLSELVAHLSEGSDEAATAEQIRLSLVHTHLPKFADHGVIEYDRRHRDVRYRDGSKLEAFLEVVPTCDCSV
jgi:DNA-binding transcriptional ArsR family regulator